MSNRFPYMDYILMAALAICMLLMMVGCKTTAPTIPTNTSSRDSAHIEYKHDSVYIDRFHRIYVKGDTVYIHDSIFRDRWHRSIDTIRTNSTDTIYQQVEIERKGSTFLRNSGIALWIILALLFTSIIIGIIIKFAK